MAGTLRKIFACLTLLLLFSGYVSSQTGLLLYNEDFEGANPAVILNDTSFGPNTGNNKWIVNNQYTGNATYPNTTLQTVTNGGLSITQAGGSYLHIHDSATANPQNANYTRTSASDRFVIVDQVICTKSFSNVQFRFVWLGTGSSNDYMEVYYQVNGGAWTQTGQNQYNNVSNNAWTQEIITDPAFENVQDIRFGFRWVNATGSPPNTTSIGIDDIFILGDMDTTINGVQSNIISVPDSVCIGANMVFGFQLTDTLCDGQYTIDLINPSNQIVAGWVFNMNFPQTTSFLSINIGNNIAPGTCYRIRVNRTMPLPQIVGNVSQCIKIKNCPTTITTLQPAVTIPATTQDSGVCVGSVIDVPFWSYGTYIAGNVYTAELSDAFGSFANPMVIGTLPDITTYDPALVPSPGSVSGLIPSPLPDGCGYMIRVVASNPVTIGTSFGPFCIKNCDIETNNKQDIQMCLTSTAGDTVMVPFTIGNAGGNNVAWCPFPNNTMNIEVFHSQTMAMVNAPGTIGSKVTSQSDSIMLILPPSTGLGAIGMATGMWYIRISGTCGQPAWNLDGTLIRLTIGAPYDQGLDIIPNPKYLCQGDVSILTVGPPGAYNPQSEYQWYLNGSPFGPAPNNSPTYPLGVVFNGAPGPYLFGVVETNFGCVGPWTPEDTVWVLTTPSGTISGPTAVCVGDTYTYNVTFQPNTAYTWGLSPPGIGHIVSNANNQITVTFDTISSSGVKLELLSAANSCGSSSGFINIVVGPPIILDAGPDTFMCPQDTFQIGGNPTASGGTPPFQYSWNPGTTLNQWNIANPYAYPMQTTTYVLTVNDGFGCVKRDSVTVQIDSTPPFGLGPNVVLCEGDTAVLDPGAGFSTYNWTTGDTSQTIVVDSGGLYRVDVLAPNGCELFDEITLTEDIINYHMPEDTFICTQNDWTFDAGNDGLIYRWWRNDTLLPDNGQFLTVTQNGEYKIQVITSDGCEKSDSLMLEFTNKIPVDLGPDSIWCPYETIELNPVVPVAATYQWSTGEISPTIKVYNPGTYYIDIITDAGCIGEDTIHIAKHPSLLNVAGPDTSTCEPFMLLQSETWQDTGVVYMWSTSPYDTLDTVRVTRSGWYTLRAISECEDITDSVYVEIIEEELQYLAPNIFSPNGDGNNDFMAMKMGTPHDNFQIHVYDRWGRLVFESFDYFFQWDGTRLDGGEAPAGVYYYSLIGLDCDGDIVEIPGNITLVR